MADELNTGLNLNRARQDKFDFMLSDIPSSPLLPQSEFDDVLAETKQKVNDMEFFRLSLQSVELPEWNVGEQKLQTQFGVATSHSTNMHDFGTLTTTLRMDEGYTLYRMMWLWMMLINDPEKVNQMSSKQQANVTQVDSYLYVKDNFGKKKLGFRFHDLRPISLPSLSLDFASEGTEIEFPVTWMFSYYIPVKPDAQPYDITLSDIPLT